MMAMPRFERIAAVAIALLTVTIAQAGETIDWSEAADFGQLRQTFGARDDFGGHCEFNDEPASTEQIVEHLKNNNWEAAATAAEGRLQACPVDIRMHMYAGIALDELQRAEAAQHHFTWYEGLTDSILATGDGHTAETAFVTISVDEEYVVLSAFRLTPKSQELVGDRDRFVVTDEAGDEHEIYFYPELHWRRFEKIFSD